MESRLLFSLIIVSVLLGNVDSYREAPNAVKEGRLDLTSLSNECLKMTYYKSASEAIHVVSEVQNHGETVHISITSLNGGVVFSVDRRSYSTALWSFAGHEFLLVNQTTIGTYFVPPEYSRMTKKAVNHEKQLRSSLLNLLDHDSVNKISRNKIEEFLRCPEVNLLIEAAESLGRSGVQGQENEPAMIFYTAALRFSKMRQENEDTSSEVKEMVDDIFPQVTTKRRQKRRTCQHGYNCFLCPLGSSCLGLCGPDCSCWEWVCGHCCFSLGCYMHDEICSTHDSDFSLECILGSPLALACDVF